MSKPFDYSKWDKIELSDDEDDVHPNIDRESWFRMKHRSRVEREENENKDKQRIEQEMAKAEKRIATLQHDLAKLEKSKASKKKDNVDSDDDDDDDDDDDLDDREALQAELQELQQQNAARQAKLDEYEKNKKWNVDNMCEVKEERTFVSPTAGTTTYTPTGYVKPKEQLAEEIKSSGGPKKSVPTETKQKTTTVNKSSASAKTTTTSSSSSTSAPAASATSASQPSTTTKTTTTKAAAAPPPVEIGAMETYHEFTERHADTVEMFMKIPDLAGSKAFLLQYGDIILQENASNYLLLASLEDEMNGYHEKMKRTARQSQIVTNIAELAKTLKTHPGNVIEPFFARLEQREHLDEFLKGVKVFQEKIVKRAVTKRQEMDAAREAEETATSLSDIPLEQRLGPGGLDPLEVVETLPEDMVAAFESRNIDDLRAALAKLTPEEAEYHMKRCVDSGLWVANAQN